MFFRLILVLELLAFYSVSPSITLLVLDRVNGILPQEATQIYGMLIYAIFIGIYPLFQIVVAPFVGSKVDKSSPKRMLQKLHLANSLGFALFAASILQKSTLLALVGLIFPAFFGGILPLVKTFIACTTEEKNRLHEFSKLALFKGVATVLGPILGLILLEIFPHPSYLAPFVFAALLSLLCFCLTTAFPLPSKMQPQQNVEPLPPSIFTFFRTNYTLLFLFFTIYLNYCIFVRFVPIVLTERFSNSAFCVSNFFATLGLATVANQLILTRIQNLNHKSFGIIVLVLSIAVFCFYCCTTNYISVIALLIILFCFSISTVYIESRVSLKGPLGNQGKIQGILYGVENMSYLAAPIIGATLATFHPLYPIAFVAFATLLTALAITFKNDGYDPTFDRYLP